MLDIQSTTDPYRFRMAVTEDICVGAAGHIFLFGGAGLAAAINAMKNIVGRELVWATAQYLSYARMGIMLDIVVTVMVEGRNISQASAIAYAGDEVIFTVSAAFGERTGHPAHQWIQMPPMPPPEDCVPWPIWPKQGAGLSARMDLRLAPDSAEAQPRDGRIDRDGRLQLWARTIDDQPIDAGLLAIFADFLPAGAASALGRVGGGNSLDNSVRLHGIVPTGWVLCDIQISAVSRGFGHGEVRMFAQDGTLMATAGQSLILRFVEP